MTLEEAISMQKNLIKQHEIANDGYYLSRQQKEDEALLHDLQRRLKQD